MSLFFPTSLLGLEDDPSPADAETEKMEKEQIADNGKKKKKNLVLFNCILKK